MIIDLIETKDINDKISSGESGDCGCETTSIVIPESDDNEHDSSTNIRRGFFDDWVFESA